MKRMILASTYSGEIGIWWILDNGKILADSRLIDEGFNDGNYINYDSSKNHLTEWKRIINENIDNENIDNEKEAKEIISKGYKSIERGRVIFNLRTQSYEVVCSQAVFKNKELRDIIKERFHLNGTRYDFIPLYHYFKVELTGNPAIDDQYYDL